MVWGQLVDPEEVPDIPPIVLGVSGCQWGIPVGSPPPQDPSAPPDSSEQQVRGGLPLPGYEIHVLPPAPRAPRFLFTVSPVSLTPQTWGYPG